MTPGAFLPLTLPASCRAPQSARAGPASLHWQGIRQNSPESTQAGIGKPVCRIFILCNKRISSGYELVSVRKGSFSALAVSIFGFPCQDEKCLPSASETASVSSRVSGWTRARKEDLRGPKKQSITGQAHGLISHQFQYDNLYFFLVKNFKIVPNANPEGGAGTWRANSQLPQQDFHRWKHGPAGCQRTPQRRIMPVSSKSVLFRTPKLEHTISACLSSRPGLLLILRFPRLRKMLRLGYLGCRHPPGDAVSGRHGIRIALRRR